MSKASDKSTLSLVFQILSRKDKWRLLIAFGLILVGTLLEMASLALVIPVVQAVVGEDRRTEYSFLPEWLEQLSYLRFVQVLMVSLVLVFLIKNLFLLASNYFQQRFQFSVTNRVVQRLFEIYLRQPYEFHLKHSSSMLVRNVQDYSTTVFSNGVAPVLTIITDVATGAGLLGVLLLVQPWSTAILLGVFGLCGYLIVQLSRTRIRSWGAQRLRHRGVLMDTLLAGLGGIKEIQIFGRDREVVEAHRTSLNQASRSFYMFNVLQSIPRAAFEVIAVCGVALLVIFSTVGGRDLREATLVVALFGVVAFRMLPSVNRVMQAVQLFSFGRAAMEGAVESLQLPEQLGRVSRAEERDKFQSAELKNVRFRYDGTEADVTEIDSLTIQVGESVGIVGESGSGKSTLVDLLIGILTPQRGVIRVNDRDISTDRRYWQDRIGYVPQHVYLMDTTIRRNVAFGLPEKEIDNDEVIKALEAANLLSFVQTLPNGLDTVVGERGVRLSGGQRQRLGIARALYGNPEVIVLDEATSALDERTEREIVESLREISQNHTLIVVAHRTSTLAYCSRILRIEHGRIVQDGTFAEVIGSLTESTDRGQ
jgi:ABC-type multidrug transport system fused ATPase/permease subunit